MLLLYGAGCVPQAYVFSLGPQIALNAMSFIIVNMVFGKCFDPPHNLRRLTNGTAHRCGGQ